MMGGQADWFAVIVCPVSCLGVYIGVTQIMETGFQKKILKSTPKKDLFVQNVGARKNVRVDGVRSVSSRLLAKNQDWS